MNVRDSELQRLRRRCLQLQDALEDMTWQFAVLGWEDMMPEEEAMRKMQEPVEGLER